MSPRALDSVESGFRISLYGRSGSSPHFLGLKTEKCEIMRGYTTLVDTDLSSDGNKQNWKDMTAMCWALWRVRSRRRHPWRSRSSRPGEDASPVVKKMKKEKGLIDSLKMFEVRFSWPARPRIRVPYPWLNLRSGASKVKVF